MSQILPPGVTPERFAAALAGFATTVGDVSTGRNLAYGASAPERVSER